VRKPTPEELDLLHDNLCSALNDKTRIAILFELAGGPQHVGQIVATLGLPQATVSRHLKVLREGTILSATRDGNRVVYEIQDLRILEVLSLLRRIHADAMRRRSELVNGVRPARVRRRRRG
jgi:ArsR family transcriptional regulator